MDITRQTDITIEKPDNIPSVETEDFKMEETEPVDLGRLISKIKTICSTEFNEYFDYLEILERKGILKDLFVTIRKNPYKTTKFAEFDNEFKRKAAYIISLVRKTQKTSFLQKVNQELKKRNEVKRVTSETPDQSLYHIISDNRLIQVIRHGFKGLDEHDKGSLSTGEFEKAIGLKGIFFTYDKQYPYYFGNHDQNLVVCTRDLAYQKDSICIEGEVSYETIVENEFTEEFQTALGGTDVYFKPPEMMTEEEIFIFTLSILLSACGQIVSPKNIIEHGMHKNTEICVNPKKIQKPQMIIVIEEPEYFYEEMMAKNSTLKDVPILSDESVKEALAELNITYKKGMARETFIRQVNLGKIDLHKWAYHE